MYLYLLNGYLGHIEIYFSKNKKKQNENLESTKIYEKKNTINRGKIFNILICMCVMISFFKKENEESRRQTAQSWYGLMVSFNKCGVWEVDWIEKHLMENWIFQFEVEIAIFRRMNFLAYLDVRVSAAKRTSSGEWYSSQVRTADILQTEKPLSPPLPQHTTLNSEGNCSNTNSYICPYRHWTHRFVRCVEWPRQKNVKPQFNQKPMVSTEWYSIYLLGEFQEDARSPTYSPSCSAYVKICFWCFFSSCGNGLKNERT